MSLDGKGALWKTLTDGTPRPFNYLCENIRNNL